MELINGQLNLGLDLDLDLEAQNNIKDIDRVKVYKLKVAKRFEYIIWGIYIIQFCNYLLLGLFPIFYCVSILIFTIINILI